MRQWRALIGAYILNVLFFCRISYKSKSCLMFPVWFSKDKTLSSWDNKTGHLRQKQMHLPLPTKRNYDRSCRQKQICPRNTKGIHCEESLWKATSNRTLNEPRHFCGTFFPRNLKLKISNVFSFLNCKLPVSVDLRKKFLQHLQSQAGENKYTAR